MAKQLTSTPPVRTLHSVQYDLFSTFFGEAAELSNTIEL